jgi:Kef-type K+ transport system membrane component KefB
MSGQLAFSIFLIFTGAALLATVALFARQAILVAYILLGIALGPSGLGLVGDPELLRQMAGVGIIFLLYLLGLDLLPQQLWTMLGEALAATVLSSALFWVVGFALARAFGLPGADAALVGAAAMFSSTIIAVKLMPTTALHHRHAGQMVISVLLLQDLLAIIVLLLLKGYQAGGGVTLALIRPLATLPLLILLAWILERFVIVRLIARFDQIHEYIFLLAIAWCLGMAQLATWMGLSHEIGAFVAGVVLASSPIALFITEKLKPLRDFFLVLFFFSIGAMFRLDALGAVAAPALALAALLLVVKPAAFRVLFVGAGENGAVSMEVGMRLGQMSEFSLLIAVLAVEATVIAANTSFLIQLATLVTFLVSSGLIVMRYPTPIAVSDRLRRD